MSPTCNIDFREINFERMNGEVFCNPRMPPLVRQHVIDTLKGIKELQNHLWFATSGTTAPQGYQRWVALSNTALLASAKAVNLHLESDGSDIWVSPLPPFHVGGIGVYARAYLSGATVYDLYEDRWNCEVFIEELQLRQATLTSLVPTHLHDIVIRQHNPPSSLRAAIVGGGRLSEDLYRAAIALGWPVLPTYGMTECSSQIATAPLESVKGADKMPPLVLLPHIEATVDSLGYLRLRSPSLFSAYALIGIEGSAVIVDQRSEEWFTTNDRVTLDGKNLTVIGRSADWVKIGGESVDVAALQDVWESCCQTFGFDSTQTALIARPDQRLGHAIVLAVIPVALPFISNIQELFHRKVTPYEQIRAIYTIPAIPRTSLNKVARQLLLDVLDATELS